MSERKSVEVTVRYSWGEQVHTWVKSSVHCVWCGRVRGVWVEGPGGDYYDGPTYVCTSCGESFCVTSRGNAIGEMKQVIDQIKAVQK